MKAESNIKPELIEVKNRKEMCKVLLRKNIQEKIVELEGGTETLYEYDEVEIRVTNRDNLEKYISDNFDMLFREGIVKEKTPDKPSKEDRIEALENAFLERVGI